MTLRREIVFSVKLRAYKFIDGSCFIQGQSRHFSNIEHLTAIKQQFPDADDHYVQRVHFDEFANWFKDHVITLQNTSDILLSEEIIALSSPPSPSATKVTMKKRKVGRPRTMSEFLTSIIL
ncbi:uncharacterized protein LOC121050026 [Rosa chinensis]|uniref:uncharacterized protein LOC121050026 n=1 Tax=Rosa chinensis TaxID=74649 RepID=UPI001AD8CC34|nr:uncharacterized protein LOC121050026 [Rosa chinensis]